MFSGRMRDDWRGESRRQPQDCVHVHVRMQEHVYAHDDAGCGPCPGSGHLKRVQLQCKMGCSWPSTSAPSTVSLRVSAHQPSEMHTRACLRMVCWLLSNSPTHSFVLGACMCVRRYVNALVTTSARRLRQVFQASTTRRAWQLVGRRVVASP